MPLLADRLTLITGASRGIGAGLARAFAGAGSHLVLVARSRGPLESVAQDCAEKGGTVRTILADLSRREDVDKVIAEAGGIDVLINNAAVGQRFLRSTEWPEDYWRKVFEVGFWTPARLMRDLGRGMAERGHGVILNISSSAGLRARPFLAHYSAVKAATDMVMQATAMELGQFGVRALSIAPGAIDTGHHGISDSRATGSPLGRIGLPSDIGDLAVFLASDAASFMTGTVIPCDGGTSAGEFSRYEPYLPHVE